MQRPHTLPRRWAMGTIAVAAALAACGGSDGDSATSDAVSSEDAGELVIDASAAGADTAAAGSIDGASEPSADVEMNAAATPDDSTTDDGTGELSDEEQALAFAECMRDEGIDWPDPTTNADGSIDPLGGRLPRDLAGASPEVTQAAADTCSPLLEGASFLPEGGAGGIDAETQDAFLEFAACLRDEGLDVTDPDFSAGAAPGAGLFGEGFDPNDPDNAAAIDACRGLFAGTPIGAGS